MQNMMSQDTKKLSRREGLQVAAGVLALGAGLGVTRIGEAQTARKAELADRVQMKWFLPGSDNSLKLVDTVTLPAKVVEAVYAGRGPRFIIKWYRGADSKAAHLADMALPSTVARLRR